MQNSIFGEYIDAKFFVYTMFVMNDYLHMLKIDILQTEIIWNF